MPPTAPPATDSAAAASTALTSMILTGMTERRVIVIDLAPVLAAPEASTTPAGWSARPPAMAGISPRLWRAEHRQGRDHENLPSSEPLHRADGAHTDNGCASLHNSARSLVPPGCAQSSHIPDRHDEDHQSRSAVHRQDPGQRRPAPVVPVARGPRVIDDEDLRYASRHEIQGSDGREAASK